MNKRLAEGKRKQLQEKANKVLAPILISRTGNIADALLFMTVLEQQIQKAAADKALKLKMEECRKEMNFNLSNPHIAFYLDVFDALKEEPVGDAVAILSLLKQTINGAAQKEMSQRSIKEFLPNAKVPEKLDSHATHETSPDVSRPE